ncbi:MAG TPA: 30S ribosomal protein S4 [Candidatus Nanoarchaeia archaeon]|nr:30S ribosomal protein S4 [Candidatus Nanoarchaeia archaeon]
MGDPRRNRKSYSGPSHPWQKARIEEEIALVKEYGLKNKKEVWRHVSALRGYAGRAKHLNAAAGKQEEKERQDLLNTLRAIGLLQENGKLEDVLTLHIKNILDRRLQTVVYKKNLARSVGQARQFITHGHIVVGQRKQTTPSYIVRKGEEEQISFVQGSALADAGHPERMQKPAEAKPAKQEKP